MPSHLAHTGTKKFWTSESLYLRNWPYCGCFKSQVGTAFGSIRLDEDSERLGRIPKRTAANFVTVPRSSLIAFAERMAGEEVVLMFLLGMAAITCLWRRSEGATIRFVRVNVNGLKLR